MGFIIKSPTTDLLVNSKPLTYLTAAQASGSGTLTVESIFGFSINQYIAIGQIGEERTEIIRLHASTSPSGSTITLASNTVQTHSVGAPIYVVDFDQVEFSRSSTESGSKSVLATNSIAADSIHSIYDDAVNSTGFAFWRFKNSGDSSFSDYADAIPYAGYDLDAAAEIFERALSLSGEHLNPRLTYPNMFDFLNDFVALANSENTRWAEAKVYNHELATMSTGDFEYTLPSNIARESDPTAIIAIRARDFPSLGYLSQRDFNKVTIELSQTKLATALTTSSTEIVLDNSSDFHDSGSVHIDGDIISYTGNTRATNTLTGVTDIDESHAVDVNVLQNQVTGVPIHYTISSRKTIRIFPVLSSQMNNRTLYLDYYKKIPRVNSIGDKILIKNIISAIEYVAYRIKKHVAGGKLGVNDEDYQTFLKDFKQAIDRDKTGEPLRIRIN